MAKKKKCKQFWTAYSASAETILPIPTVVMGMIPGSGAGRSWPDAGRRCAGAGPLRRSHWATLFTARSIDTCKSPSDVTVRRNSHNNSHGFGTRTRILASSHTERKTIKYARSTERNPPSFELTVSLFECLSITLRQLFRSTNQTLFPRYSQILSGSIEPKKK